MYIRSAIMLGLLTLISTVQLYSFSKDENASSIFNTPPRRFNAIPRPHITTDDLDASERSSRSCERLTSDTDTEEQERKISSELLTPLTPSLSRSTGILKSISTSSLSSIDPLSPKTPKTVRWIDYGAPTPTSPASREHYWSPKEAQQYWDVEEANQDAVIAYVETAMPSQFNKHPLKIDVIGRLFNVYGYATGEDKTKLLDYITRVLDYGKEDLSEKNIERLQQLIKSSGPQVTELLEQYKPVKPTPIIETTIIETPVAEIPFVPIITLSTPTFTQEMEWYSRIDHINSWGAETVADVIESASKTMEAPKIIELARYAITQQKTKDSAQELKKHLQERFVQPLPQTDPLAEQWQKLLGSF